MSGPIAIRYELNGRQVTNGAFSEAELAEYRPDIEAMVGSVEVIPDGLAEVRERFPAGTRVRATAKAPWKHGHGTVTRSDSRPGYARWPEVPGDSWFLGNDGAEVCVKFDGDNFADWWPTYMIEPA
jgi:hypothetical protein